MKQQISYKPSRKMISVKTKEELEEQVKNIADITGREYVDLENIGVLGGRSGVALFQFHCAQYFDEDSYAETGVQIIESCMEQINNGYSFPTYCNGIAGFGWALQHLVDLDFIALDLDELLNPFDDYLSSQMEFEFKKEYYDLLHGALGYGLYFLKRYNGSSTSEQYKKKYKGFLTRLVQLLEEMAIEDGDGLKWESILDIEKGNKGFNLSLSHGMSSIIYLLYKMYRSQIEKKRVSDLVKGAMNYMEQFEITNQDGISRYPSWIDPNKDLDYNSRVAWCYGDIGIAKAFEWVGNILRDQRLKNRSRDILLHVAHRKSPESAMVVDAGYCHGSFGNAHIFKQLELSNGEEKFEEVAEHWFADGLSKNTGNLHQPYKQWRAREESFEFELNLLEGISGIGLVMLDFPSGQESTWDECLMLR